MLINQRHAEFSLAYSAEPAQAGDGAFIFRSGEVLLRAETMASRIPAWEAVADIPLHAPARHAFTQDGRRYFIAEAVADTPTPDGLNWETVRVFRTLQPETDAALLLTARHLFNWYQSRNACCLCSGSVRPHETERALVCDQCGYVNYPSVLPAVIVAITDNDRLLLARNAQNVFRFFSLIAGFVEVGETAEQAVHREVLEEVGLRVKNVRYVASQPWGISQSLMLGFTAELDGPDTIRLQESELAEARWFTRADVPHNDSTTSIAFDMMERFRLGQL
ncbi:MAG TPA: NAD(+) diphosphatase [Candidatus Limiplasma sp.]|nr:NAD(+) diphosphatase [Candidatus Limiplasma sp.]HRX08037.1 NAD(+) diphosphatase [Candidatus Limiplasma sp.]